MAYLEKLTIQGIRSFGGRDEDKEKMNFYSAYSTNKRDADGRPVTDVRPWPLTLILGQNGCGKTTIIECLRYVTTGDTPPGSKMGKSFVHDPKMAGEISILGNVKLSFRAGNRCQYLVIRNIEAMQKAKQISVKTLDGMLHKTDSQGNRTSLSMKCADMNTAVLESLGVSKPILNYVIFCHQEDSNWPLEEGSKVKAKFDEIFASDKYQNCLKNIKETTKKHREELRMDKKSLEFLAGDKRMAADKKRELEEKKDKANVLEDHVKEASEQLKPIMAELDVIRDTEINYTGMIQDLERAKTLREEKLKQIEEIEGHLDTFYEESADDEEVAERKNKIEGEAKLAEKRLQQVKLEIDDRVAKKNDLELQRTKKIGELAECHALRKAYVEICKELDEKSVAMGSQLKWKDIHTNVSHDDSSMEELLKRLKTQISEAEKEARRVEQEMDSKVEEKSSEVNNLERTKALSEDKRKRLQTEMIDGKKEIAIINREIREAQESLEKMQEIQDNFEKKESEQARLRNSCNISELREKVAKKERELKELEKKEASLREEKALLDANLKTVSDISLKEKDREEIVSKRSMLERKTCEKLKVIFGAGCVPSIGMLKDRFNQMSEQISRDKKLLEKDLQELGHEMESKKEKRRLFKLEIKAKEEKIERFSEEMAELNVVDNDLESELDTIKSEIETDRDELAQREAKKFTNQEYLQTMGEMSKHDVSCPTCHRKFQKATEADELKEELQKEITAIPDRVKAIKDRVRKALQRQERLQMLLPEKKQIDEAKKEVTEKNSAIKTLDIETKKLDSDYTFKESELSKTAVDNLICEENRDKVFEIDNLHRQETIIEGKLQELRLQNSDLDSVRPLEEFQKEEEQVLRKINAARQEIKAKQTAEMNFERQVNQLAKECNGLQQELLHIRNKQQSSANLDKRRKELEGKVDVASVSLKGIDEQLNAMADSIEVRSREKNKLMAERSSKVEAARKDCNEIRRMEAEAQNMVDKVQSYEAGGNERKLEERLTLMESLSTKIEDIGNKLQSLDGDRSTCEKLVLDKGNFIREIDDNIRWRRLKKEEKEFADEVRRYGDRLKALNFDKEKQRKDDLVRKYQTIDRKKSEQQGRLDEMRGTIRSLEKELQNEKFREAEKKFRDLSVSHRCRQHAIQDMEKYYKALNYAITRFHEERMRVINKIVKELWRATYKGNDIDYIEIKTDQVDPEASMEKKRVCNYQVVMIKNNTEMEMRGRCSAGQKVLASLLIRLALAETFSANCGIIALDEPTTNLDRENIDSLSEALANIVQKRSTSNRNFQLIIITHDEDLITSLGRGVPEQNYYYKISRNDRGLSQIRKFNIDSLGSH